VLYPLNYEDIFVSNAGSSNKLTQCPARFSQCAGRRDWIEPNTVQVLRTVACGSVPSPLAEARSVEPGLPASETGALSIELRGHLLVKGGDSQPADSKVEYDFRYESPRCEWLQRLPPTLHLKWDGHEWCGEFRRSCLPTPSLDKIRQ